MNGEQPKNPDNSINPNNFTTSTKAHTDDPRQKASPVHFTTSNITDTDNEQEKASPADLTTSTKTDIDDQKQKASTIDLTRSSGNSTNSSGDNKTINPPSEQVRHDKTTDKGNDPGDIKIIDPPSQQDEHHKTTDNEDNSSDNKIIDPPSQQDEHHKRTDKEDNPGDIKIIDPPSPQVDHDKTIGKEDDSGDNKIIDPSSEQVGHGKTTDKEDNSGDKTIIDLPSKQDEHHKTTDNEDNPGDNKIIDLPSKQDEHHKTTDNEDNPGDNKIIDPPSPQVDHDKTIGKEDDSGDNKIIDPSSEQVGHGKTTDKEDNSGDKTIIDLPSKQDEHHKTTDNEDNPGDNKIIDPPSPQVNHDKTIGKEDDSDDKTIIDSPSEQDEHNKTTDKEDNSSDIKIIDPLSPQVDHDKTIGKQDNSHDNKIIDSPSPQVEHGKTTDKEDNSGGNKIIDPPSPQVDRDKTTDKGENPCDIKIIDPPSPQVEHNKTTDKEDNSDDKTIIDPPSKQDEITDTEYNEGIKSRHHMVGNSPPDGTSSQRTSISSLKTSDDATKKNTTNNPLLTKMVVVFLSMLVLVISILIFMYKFSSYREACDMNKAENRDFNNYYGIINVENHFTTSSADKCDSNIIFKAALPGMILKSDNSASSFMILSKYGTGKTLLRCEYYKSLRSDTYFKVLILNKQINEFLERFVKEKATSGKDCENETCITKWSKNEFGQLLLSLLVTQFVDTFEKEQFNLPDISLAEKIELITIICYYYNGEGVNRLEKFVNSFLKKIDNSMYIASKAEVQIKERHFYQDKPLLIHLKNDLNKLSAIKQDEEKLHLLLGIVEGENFQYKTMETTMSGNIFNDLTHIAQFLKNNLKRTPVFIIDGIDENQYFFHQHSINKSLLELFYRSSISQDIFLATIPQDFYLSIFYLKIDGINIQDATVRNDKFPIHTINWNTKSLIDYADYILEEMNKNASASRCKSLKDFKTLVNYDNKKNAEIINQISTPRALHYFMQNLIIEMNHCANVGQESFIATAENIYTAYQNSHEPFVEHDSNVY